MLGVVDGLGLAGTIREDDTTSFSDLFEDVLGERDELGVRDLLGVKHVPGVRETLGEL